MRGLVRIAGIVAVSMAVLLMSASHVVPSSSVAEAASTRGVVFPRGGADELVQVLGRLTKRAVLNGRRLLTTEEAKFTFKLGNNVRKATNYYCGQWVDHFRLFPYRAPTTKAAVRWWSFAAERNPEYPAGSAYRHCKRLGYWAILFYEPR